MEVASAFPTEGLGAMPRARDQALSHLLSEQTLEPLVCTVDRTTR
jgi:hypothetical protein